ncbi:MAG: hypothetical protein AAFR79_10525 [Pseudomonadota bacterium]
MSIETAESTDAPREPKRSIVRVRECLIQPLVEDGLRKARNTRADKHDEFLKRLERDLDWMTAEGLTALRHSVLEKAEGERRNLWPSYATVWNIARVIEHPPDKRREMVLSWMRSNAGVRAWDLSPWHAVALHWYLETFGPANRGGSGESFATRKINEKADQLTRTVNRLRACTDADSSAKLEDLERQAGVVRKMVFPNAVGTAS